jgi:hypothetical protein
MGRLRQWHQGRPDHFTFDARNRRLADGSTAYTYT